MAADESGMSALTHVEKHHPAKYSSSVLDALGELWDFWLQPPEPDRPSRVLDPWAGVGRIHRIASLAVRTFAVELELNWAASTEHANRTVSATTRRLPFADGVFDAVTGSPVYMNRMRDSHMARDTSKRNTYTHQMRALTGFKDEQLHPDNMGAMTNTQYRAAAAEHIAELLRVSKPGAFWFINLSNSIEDGEENNCVEQWINWLTLRSLHIREVRPVATPRNGFGANGDARCDYEVVVVAQTPAVKLATLL